jgi:hypothetical protein
VFDDVARHEQRWRQMESHHESADLLNEVWPRTFGFEDEFDARTSEVFEKALVCVNTSGDGADERLCGGWSVG